MTPIAEYMLSGFSVLLILLLVWYLLLTDRDVVLTLHEKYGRPVSDFAGKVVWITGASTGLGEAMAYELASVGAKLILTARSVDLLQNVKEKCIDLSRGKLGITDVQVVPFDLSNFACHKEMVEDVIHHFGRIDVLVNNAAICQIGPIMDTELEVDKTVFDVNFFGPINLSKLVLKQFLQQGKGHFVVISSITGKTGAPSIAAYASSKHALQGYFESLRNEHQKDKIDVTMVCPGIFSSSIFNRMLTTKTGQILQKDYGHYECCNMSSERCAHLALVATINKQFEAWIAFQPTLLMLWTAQFFPDFYKYVMNILYSKKRLAELYQGKWPKDVPVWRPLFSK